MLKSQSYLLWGYWRTQSDEYAFEWTIPQCVLTLRLIAVVFDVYDGYRLIKLEKSENAANAQEIIKNDEALYKPPTFMQLAAHSYFPASFLVGPQFGLKRYLNFVSVTDSFLPIRYANPFPVLVWRLFRFARNL